METNAVDLRHLTQKFPRGPHGSAPDTDGRAFTRLLVGLESKHPFHSPTLLDAFCHLNSQCLWCLDSWLLDMVPWYSLLKVGTCAHNVHEESVSTAG